MFVFAIHKNKIDVISGKRVEWAPRVKFGYSGTAHESHYAFCYRGRECELKPALGDNRLVTEAPVKQSTTQFTLLVEWELCGCVGLPIHTQCIKFLQDNIEDSSDRHHLDIITKVAEDLFPREGAVIGFTDASCSTRGAMLFRRHIRGNLYEVECFAICSTAIHPTTDKFYSYRADESGQAKICFATSYH